MDSAPNEFPIADLARQVESLRALARGLVGDEHLAEDIVQEASLAALERPPRKAFALAAWLRRTVIRRASNMRRARSRRSDHEALSVRSASVPSPEEISSRVEVQEHLLRAVRNLPEIYRDVIWLRYWEREGAAEIAARLGLPLETVRTRLRRAHERLSAEMDELSGGERRNWFGALVVFSGGGEPEGAALSAPLLAPIAVVTVTALVFVLPHLLARNETETSSDAPFQLVLDQREERDRSNPERASAAREPLRPTPPATEFGQLEVHVRWPNGEVANDVGVTLSRPAATDRERTVRQAATSAEGVATFTALTPGSYRVELFRGGRGSVEVRRDESARLELEVQHGIDVRGIVVDESGVPVPSAEIWMSKGGANWTGGREASRAGVDGRFALRNVHPRHAILARASGYAPSAPIEIAALDNTDNTQPRECILVVDTEAGSLRGTVRDETGAAVMHARVALRSPLWRPRDAQGQLAPPPPAFVTTTDAAGVYEMKDVPRGASDLSVLADGYALWIERVEIEEQALEEIVLSPGFSFAGHVIDARGQSVPTALIRLRLESHAGDAEPAFRLPMSATDEAGRFRFANLPHLPIEVHVANREQPELGQASLRLAAQPGEVVERTLTLTLDGTLHGSVVASDGAPLPELLVHAQDEGSLSVSGGQGAMAKTDAQGRFFLGPRNGPQQLEVYPGFGFGTLARRRGVETTASPLHIVVPPEREPTGGIRARLRFATVTSGSIRVEAEEYDRRSGFARMVEDGEIAFDAMVPGRYRLRAFDGQRPLHIGEWFRLEPNDVADLGEIVLAPLANLRLRFETSDGSALDGVYVSLSDPERRLFVYPKVSAPEAVVADLLPGRYELAVRAQGYAAHFAHIEVPAAAQGASSEAHILLERGVRTKLSLATGELDWRRLDLLIRESTGAVRERRTFLAGDEPALELLLRDGKHVFEARTASGRVASGEWTVDGPSGETFELACDWTTEPEPETHEAFR